MKSRHAQVAALIRAELKKHGIAGTARSRSYAGGESVDVTIHQDLMPATVKAVEAYCGQFEYGQFNGMIDLYEYTNSRDDIPQVKFLHVNVRYSDAIRADAAAYIAGIRGIDEHERDRYAWMALNGSWGDFWTSRKPRVRL